MTVPDAPIGPPVDMSQQMADETDKLAVIHISHPAPEIWDMVREEFTAPGMITRGLSREQVISRVYRARHNHFGGSIYGQVECLLFLWLEMDLISSSSTSPSRVKQAQTGSSGGVTQP
ncbi:hypothetical protein P3T76_014627 [Phytophthora citrophthora]|uniref:Uncharacterized protein n=1 Tax=Phytophthora citrophthora TaxID=4793 RepID=A0AAD9G1W4_9STRA|nr:hypothetical protein P3T76_014627 [Phytophthora citrophthora]